ncbi:hypothetical protein [Marinitoga lauensis]|uniref:hypothetical protein n=1 Tax=Marinitoga lauensis TaxID=2201189 RepID=UPI0010136EC9|nr:hypothetical protein [Marinitoga lauensis]
MKYKVLIPLTLDGKIAKKGEIIELDKKYPVNDLIKRKVIEVVKVSKKKMIIMTNLERMRIELRDNNSKVFSDSELEAWLGDHGLNKDDLYVAENKTYLMLAVRDALRQLLRDWDSAKTTTRGDYQESYSKTSLIREIERITREYEWDIVAGEMSYED